jgi:hypothetical protein
VRAGSCLLLLSQDAFQAIHYGSFVSFVLATITDEVRAIQSAVETSPAKLECLKVHETHAVGRGPAGIHTAL